VRTIGELAPNGEGRIINANAERVDDQKERSNPLLLVSCPPQAGARRRPFITHLKAIENPPMLRP